MWKELKLLTDELIVLFEGFLNITLTKGTSELLEWKRDLAKRGTTGQKIFDSYYSFVTNLNVQLQKQKVVYY